MSAGLARQLTGYGDVFAAEVDALSRETIMTTDEAIIAIDRNEHDKKRSPWLRVSALVGAAAVVIAATVGLTVLRTGNDVVAAPPYATVEDAARARAQALTQGDWDAYRATLSDDATDELVSKGQEIARFEQQARLRFAYFVALGYEERIESCTVTGDLLASCTLVTYDSIGRALGDEEETLEVTFAVEDGLLTFVGGASLERSEIADEFRAWMVEEDHPASPWTANGFIYSPVGKDPEVVAAGVLEAVDEFLAQYEG